MRVSSLYVAQVKRKDGIIGRENYNKGEEGRRVPPCPPEEEKVIGGAPQHFPMILTGSSLGYIMDLHSFMSTL